MVFIVIQIHDQINFPVSNTSYQTLKYTEYYTFIMHLSLINIHNLNNPIQLDKQTMH